MPGGRPSKFKPEFVEQGRILASAGWTVAEMAAFWKVAERTVRMWMAHHPEFAAAIREGRVLPDDTVEESLFRRAVGYSHPDEQIRVLQNGRVVKIPTVKHYPPHPAAAMFWLKNRRPDRWRDKQQDETETEQPAPVKVELMAKDARQREEPEPDEPERKDDPGDAE